MGERPSRQRVVGDKVKRKNTKVKNKTIQELQDENAEMRKALSQHDDQLAEMDFKLREAEIENLEFKEKLKNLEDLNDKDAFENDDWVKKVYKNMSSTGKKYF